MKFITDKFMSLAPQPQLKIIKLGSDVGATKNMTVYECGDDIIIVDCGIGFPDSDLPGVDVVIPDITYLLERKDRIRGLFVSHGHEDHFGAIPYLIDQLMGVTIYANDLVQGFLKVRLEDRGITEGVSFVLLKAGMDEINLGNFKISTFRVNHSVPNSLGFAIKTPQGVVLHIADYKIDWSPVLDEPIELDKIAEYGDNGVLCLLSDCLGVTHEGYSKSEQTLGPTLDLLFEKATGKQIFITTISSNISRMHQVITAAIKVGRKVVYVGRSIKQSAEVAKGLGYLPFSDDVIVDLRHIENYDPSSLVIIIAGCYGQQGSALHRLSQGEHKQFSLNQGDYVIFSADPGPPSSYEPVEAVLHYLTVAGAEVIYSQIQENLHVSGHGMRGDLQTVSALTKAKYYIPIGGTAAKMRAYAHMVEEFGVKRENVYELLEGETVIFEDGNARMGEKVEVEQIYIDSGGMDKVGTVVIKDRERLSDDGVFVVVVPINKEKNQIVGGTEIITRGFIYVKENKSLVGRSKDVVNKLLDKHKGEEVDWSVLRPKVEKEIEKFLQKETGRKPLVIVSSIHV